ncbi:hypothetical protein T06_5364, partial [Trichinella sp. T6]
MLALGTLLDCWGGAHHTLEKHVLKAGIRRILYMMVSNLLLAKNATKVSLKNHLSRARYSAHFDTKLSSIVLFVCFRKDFVFRSPYYTEKFNKIDVINLLITLYLELAGSPILNIKKAIAVVELHAFETIIILSLVVMETAAIFPYSLQKGNAYINIGNSQNPTIIHHMVVYTEELH